MASQERRKSGWRSRAAAALVGLALSLIACELGARWLYLRDYQREARQYDEARMMLIREPDRDYEYRMKPDHSGSNTLAGHTWRLTTNSRGFRGREIAPRKTPSRFRMLFLGDSVTFGVGVEDDEVFTELVAAESGDGGRAIEVVNLGVPGYNLHQECALLEEQIDLWNPDVVALTLGPNDAEPQFTVPPHPRHALRKVRFWFLERTRETLNDLFHGSAEHHPLKRLRYDVDWTAGFEPDNPKRRLARTAFARMAGLCRDREIPLLTLYANTCDTTLLDDAYSMVRNAFADWARAEGVPHVDLFERQAARGHRELWINHDAHPNALGHELIAEGWLEALRPMIAKAELDSAPR